MPLKVLPAQERLEPCRNHAAVFIPSQGGCFDVVIGPFMAKVPVFVDDLHGKQQPLLKEDGQIRRNYTLILWREPKHCATPRTFLERHKIS